MNRDEILAHHQERMAAREVIETDLADAKINLNPRNILRRWTGKKIVEAQVTVQQTGQLLKRNAPLIGALGIGVLFFAKRKSISELTRKLRHHRIKEQDPT